MTAGLWFLVVSSCIENYFSGIEEKKLLKAPKRQTNSRWPNRDTPSAKHANTQSGDGQELTEESRRHFSK